MDKRSSVFNKILLTGN